MPLAQASHVCPGHMHFQEEEQRNIRPLSGAARPYVNDSVGVFTECPLPDEQPASFDGAVVILGPPFFDPTFDGIAGWIST